MVFELRKASVYFCRQVSSILNITDAEGIHATESKIQAIVKAPTPIRMCLNFGHFWDYYGRFIPNQASLIHPLNPLLCQGVPCQWTKACQNAFCSAKKIISPNVLVHYDPRLPITLAADASAYELSAVIFTP